MRYADIADLVAVLVSDAKLDASFDAGASTARTFTSGFSRLYLPAMIEWLRARSRPNSKADTLPKKPDRPSDLVFAPVSLAEVHVMDIKTSIAPEALGDLELEEEEDGPKVPAEDQHNTASLDDSVPPGILFRRRLADCIVGIYLFLFLLFCLGIAIIPFIFF